MTALYFPGGAVSSTKPGTRDAISWEVAFLEADAPECLR
jgi:hypothetical protein